MKKILIITRNALVNLRQMADPRGITPDGQFQFFINDYDCNPDFVVVNSKALRHKTTFPVAKSHTILITDEPYSVLSYPKGYYSQFGIVFTTQKQIHDCKGTCVIHTQTLLPSYVGATFEPDRSNRFLMTYDDIRRDNPRKTKLISVIASYKSFSKGHADRIRFVRRLRDRYGDKIDIFGEQRHSYDFKDKYDVLAPYKYQIVIENSCTPDYWTEKIADCFLTRTYPFYHGCTNIDKYFPHNAYTPIDINNFDKAVEIIETGIKDDLYAQSQKELSVSKELVLSHYNMFNVLAETCASIDKAKGETTLRPASDYLSMHNLWLYTIGRNYYKLKTRLHL